MLAENVLVTKSGAPPVQLSRRVLLRPLCPYYLGRPRLIELLNRGSDGRFTLIVAPAGFGKTTMLNAWRRATSVPVAWLPLTAGDGHLRAFIHALTTAVQSVSPSFGDGVLGLLLTEHPPPIEFIALAISRELADLGHELILVLDGYEAISDPSAQQLVGALLEQLPTTVRVVVASRTTPPFPLARLRVRGHLTEIGPDELRFRPDEATALLAQLADGDLPTPAVKALNDRLEGWPSLLSLVALRIEQATAGDALVRAASGSAESAGMEAAIRRQTDRDIEAFMIEEILEAQPLEVQQLLLRTSIVDALSVELCDALLGCVASMASAPAMLDRLERQHLLIESVDEPGTWYRYPDVLRDALRRRLTYEVTPLELLALRRRACEWFAARGMVDEAIEQAVACGHMERAAELVEGSVADLLTTRDFRVLDRRLGKLTPEIVARRPRLILARAWLLNFLTRFEAIPAVLADFDRALELNDQGHGQAELERLRAESATIRALVALIAGDGEQVMTMARQAQDTLHGASGYLSTVAAAYFGIGLYLDGQSDAALVALKRVCREAPQSIGLDCAMGNWALAWISLMAGRPRDALQWASHLVQAAGEDNTVASAWGFYLQGLAYYELNRLSEARAALVEADGRRNVAHRLSVRNTLLGLAMVEQADGNLVATSDTLRVLRELPDIANNPTHVATIKVFEARLAHATGNPEAVREILAGVGNEPLPVTIESIAGSPTLTLARMYIALGGEEDLAEAARLLDMLDVAAASVNDQLQPIGVLASRALLCQARGEASGAIEFLEQAIALAAPHGLVRSFVDLGPPMQRLIAELDRRATSFQTYLAQLLAAFPSADGQPGQLTPLGPGPRLRPELSEPLTWRETEVLRLLDARLSNQEIAAILVISADTVKKHTINIYQKLQVSGRRAAVARSYALGILPAGTPAVTPEPRPTPHPFLNHRRA